MKKDIDVKCYELTLTPNYVSDWTFNDALRELIQNGTDQQEDVKKVKAYGGNPVVVPSGVAKLLKEEKEKRIKTLMEIPCASVMTLKDKFNRWYDIYAEKLPPEAQVEIRNLIEELE